MTIAKVVTKTLDVGVKDTKIDLAATIKSYDLTDTKFIFNIVSNQGINIDLMGSTATYVVEYVHNLQSYAIQGEVDIVDSTTIAFSLPEDLKGYKGTVLIGLYVQMTDGTKIDIKDIIVRVEPSIMDKDIDFSAKTYFQDFESVKTEVVLAGENAKNQINAVVSDVNGYADSQKQAIDNIVSDVQSTGDTAKEEIRATLPTLQNRVSQLSESICELMPTNEYFDFSNLLEKHIGYWMVGFLNDKTPDFVSAPNGGYAYLNVENLVFDTLIINKPKTGQFGQQIFAVDSNGKVVFNTNYAFLTSDEQYSYIDIKGLLNAYNNIAKLGFNAWIDADETKFISKSNTVNPKWLNDYASRRYVDSVIEEFANPAEIVLPSTLYGVVGLEINVYKENLLLYNRLKKMAYIHTRFGDEQDDRRTVWMPSSTSLNNTNRNFEVFTDGLKTVVNKSIKIMIAPKDTGSATKKVLIIGDSKVDNGYVSSHFLHNFDDDNMSVKLLGTKYDWNVDNRNEGYGGKTAKWFCTDSKSPFCNNGAFDFANYLSQNSIETPDFVFINLGTNDCGLSATGFEITYITYIKEMISSIHSVSQNIHVIVGLCEGVSTAKDVNTAEFLNWDLNYKIQILHKKTIEELDNKTDEKIWLCPMYMGMDLEHDYNGTEVPLSARDEGKTSKTRFKISDNVHQNEVGYWKNADYMYAIFKNIIANENAIN